MESAAIALRFPFERASASASKEVLGRTFTPPRRPRVPLAVNLAHSSWPRALRLHRVLAGTGG